MTLGAKLWRGMGRGVVALLAVAWLIFAFYPVVYMFLTSIRSQAGFLIGVPWLPPRHPTWANYQTVLANGFLHFMFNSAVVTVVSVLLIVLCALPAAYSIVRTHRRPVRLIFNIFLVGLAVPMQAAIIPIFVEITHMHLYDTRIGLILPSVAFGLPLTILILVNFVRDVPRELYDSMQLDGVGEIGLLWHLVFPLSRPALVSVVIYNFVQVWNNFLFPLILTQSPSKRLLPLAIVSFQGQFSMDVPALMAAVLLSAIPLIVAYIVGRRYLLRGLTAGFNR
jgi:raffinose/stachyose/melibiose transport system permease protein